MTWTALVPPRLGTEDDPGMCLRFSQSFFGAPVRYRSAWEAWQNQTYRHPPSDPLPNVPVLLWYSHWGTYGRPLSYENWGHVTPLVPGVGIFSSPDSPYAGWSQSRFSTIAEVERAFNCKYVGWSEDINGLRVAENTGSPSNPTNKKRKRKNSMATLYCQSSNNKRPGQGGTNLTWFLAGDSPGTPANWLPTTDQKVANGWAAAHGDAIWLTKDSIAAYKKSYQTAVKTR